MSLYRTLSSVQTQSNFARRSQVLGLAVAVTLLSGTARAVDVVKLDNTAALNSTSAWFGDVTPGPLDVAVWDGTITSGPITNALGDNLSWGGIRIASPAGLVTISAGNTLTIGASGIDMSGASQSFTIDATLATLAGSKQSWSVASGQTLTLSAPLRGTRSTINFSGDGSVVLNGDTASSLLAWASVNSTTDIAALDASKVVKPATTVFTYVQPSGGNVSGTVVGVNVNQPATAGSTQAYRHSNSLTTTNGIRFGEDNFGASLWTVDTSSSGRVNTTPVIFVSSGVTQDIQYNGSGGVRARTSGGELVLNHNGSGNLIFNTTINGNGTSSLLKLGAGQLIIASNSGYTGQTSVMDGTLQVGNGGTAGSLSSGTILLNNTTVAFNRSDAAGVYAGVITGAGVVDINNASTGAYALSNAANSFTGPVNINGGGLIINNIGNIPATSTINLNGGTIQYATATTVDLSARTIASVGNGTINTNGNDVTYANPIGNGGTGGITKVGAGVLTFTAVNTYTGGTTVDGGTLRISNTTGAHPGNVTVNTSGTLGGVGTIAGSTTVNSGGTLAPGASIGTLHTGSLDLQGGSAASWEFAVDGSSYDKVVVDQSGGLTLNGGAFTLLNEGTVNPFSAVGDYNLIQYTGAVAGAGTAALSIANPQAGKAYGFSLDGSFLKLSITTTGVVSQWINTAGGSWGVATNWSPNTVPNTQGATANFTTDLGAGASATVTLDGTKTVGAVVFQSSGTYTIAQGSGGNLTFDNGGSLATVSVLQGNHVISTPISLLSGTQVSTVADSSVTMSGTISGGSGLHLHKNGPGTLVLTGNNSFAGDVQLNDGTLGVGHNNALGAGMTYMNTTGSLRFDANNLVIPNIITIDTNSTGVIDTQTNTVTLNNEMNGAGTFTKAGNGTLIAANNLYAGRNVVSAGTLVIGNGASGVLGGTLTNNGVVVLNRSDDQNFGNLIAGTGMFVKANSNVTTLTTGMTYTGDTRVAGGTLVLGDSNAISFSTLDYDNYGGNISFGGNTAVSIGGLKGSQNLALLNDSAAAVNLTVGGSGQSSVYSGVLSGAGSTLTKIGAGTFTLNKVQTYTGGTVVGATGTGGVLEIATGGDISSAPLIFTQESNSTLLISGGQFVQPATSVDQSYWSNLRVTGGTFTAAGLSHNLINRTFNTLLQVDGGVVNLGTFQSGRLAISTITSEPAAGQTGMGIVTTGGTLNITGTAGIGTRYNTNSSMNMRLDGGVVNIGGTATLSINNTGRWSIIDVNGGALNITDAVAGLVLGGGGGNNGVNYNFHEGGNNIFMVRNGVANVSKIQMGVLDIEGVTSATDATPKTWGYIGTQVVGIYGGALYMGAGGIVDIQQIGVGTETIRTTNIIRMGGATFGGILGANADWASRQNIDLRNNTALSVIKAADAAGVAHNITLSGIASGTGGFNKTGAGTLTMTGANTYAGNTTVTAGTLVLGPQAQTPILTGAGAVLNGGKLVMDYTGGSSPQTTIVADLITNAPTGFQAGKARTSLAVDNTRAIGWLDNGTSTFQARYTHKGDVDLSGVVDSVDFNSLVAGYGKTSGAIWADGDTDYDGKVNTIDFNYLAGNFGAAAISAPLPAAALGSVVPEPSTLGLVGIGAMTMIARRRRNA